MTDNKKNAKLYLIKGESIMLFEPPIDELARLAGCRYAVAIIVGARAKDLENKIPTLLNGSANLAIDYAANELFKGEVIGVQSK